MIGHLLPVFPVLWVLANVARLLPSPVERDRPAERMLYDIAVGLAIFSYLLLVLGLLGFFHRTSFILLLGALAVLSIPGQARRFSDFRTCGATRSSNTPPLLPSDPFRRFIVVLSAAIVACMVIGCASPPTGSDWDGLSYHLADPMLFLQAGRIQPLPWEHHSNFPFLVQMLFSFGLAFDSPVFAKSFHLSMGILTAIGLLLVADRFSHHDSIDPRGTPTQKPHDAPFDTHCDAPSSRFRLLPAILFVGAPLVFWEGTVAYVDLGAAFYAFLAVAAFLTAFHPPDEPVEEVVHRRRWLLLSGVMTGCAVGCKTTNGIILLLLLAGCAVLAVRRKRNAADAIGWVIRIAAPALLIAAPWFVKSWLWTGNPVYPFFYSLFGGANWNAELARIYEMEQAQFGMGKSAAGFLLLPWNLTFHPEEFSKGIGSFASLGPFPLAFLPLLLRLRRIPWWIRGGLIVVAGYMVIWFGLTQQIRYLLPCYPILCLAAAFAVECACRDKNAVRESAGKIQRRDANSTPCDRNGNRNPERDSGERDRKAEPTDQDRTPAGGFERRGRGVILAFVGMVLAITLWQGFRYVQPMIPVALGRQSPEDYLRATFQLAPVAGYIEQLPRNTRILMLEETRGFYIRRPYMWGNPGHHTLIPWSSFRDGSAMTAWLRRNGFTHVLLNTRWMRPNWGESDWEAVVAEAMRNGSLRRVFHERGAWLFAVNPESEGSSDSAPNRRIGTSERVAPPSPMGGQE